MTFTVATIAREPWPILERFLRWHLGQGAARIILFLDDPNDPCLPRLAGEPRIDARPCTPELWAQAGVKPDARFTRRQRAVLTLAYRELREGWLLVLDADELMWLRDRPINAALDSLPDEALSLRVLSAEQLRLSDGSEAFRTPIERAAVDRVYGDKAPLLRARFGLTYHPEGKSFHRAGQQGLRMKLHWATDAEGARTPGPVWGAPEGAHLLHYAAPDYDRWRAKVDWRAGAHGFAQPVKDRLGEIAASPDPEPAYRALFDDLHTLSDREARALDVEGGLLRHGPEV
ncbi:glycosyltransferase family 2 protein [Gymnodinialimonas ceratoperidinii]|uniref:Glycosyltransferase family 2 protein n=1 Tax=Gymnodinialimonas ceratoperidinii TaxID=2856823 RepID=A0A8F6TY35_9RHOB|nr:glycosyltransferase family 2 protein [Gymnodinialimonas ceratoperidinii]QXT40830.1 glycosyltransferase family 2 protein [Gymnodinialimonas ceratoperidinii]